MVLAATGLLAVLTSPAKPVFPAAQPAAQPACRPGPGVRLDEDGNISCRDSI